VAHPCPRWRLPEQSRDFRERFSVATSRGSDGHPRPQVVLQLGTSSASVEGPADMSEGRNLPPDAWSPGSPLPAWPHAEMRHPQRCISCSKRVGSQTSRTSAGSPADISEGVTVLCWCPGRSPSGGRLPPWGAPDSVWEAASGRRLTGAQNA